MTTYFDLPRPSLKIANQDLRAFGFSRFFMQTPPAAYVTKVVVGKPFVNLCNLILKERYL